MAKENTPDKSKLPEHVRKMFEQKGILPKSQNDAEKEEKDVEETEKEQNESKDLEQSENLEENTEEKSEEKDSQNEDKKEKDKAEGEEEPKEENQDKEFSGEGEDSEKKKEDEITEEKSEENAGEKKEKKPRKKLTKKQIIFIAVASAVFVLAIVITILVLHFNAVNKKMDTPVLSVYETSTGTMLYVDENERAVGYEFFIKLDGETKVTTIPSETNEISLKSYLSTPGRYEIYARYVGVNTSATSKHSDTIVYDKLEKLSTPVVTKNETKLEWVQIQNAAKYHVYYKVEGGVAKYFEVSASDAATVSFELSRVSEVGTGAYSISVVAVGRTGGFYESSDLSEAVSHIVSKKLEKVTDVEFNKQTKRLVFRSQDSNSDSYLISINDGKIVLRFDNAEDESLVRVDLSPLLSEVSVSKIAVTTISDNEYLLTSDITEITVL